MATQPTLRQMAAHNPVAKRLASRFVAGETLESALDAARRSNQAGLKVSLDELGENTGTRQVASTTAEGYCRALEAIAAEALDANISCKLTHLGLDLDEEFAETQMRRVVAKAAECRNFARIDMEGSTYTQATVDITKRIFASYPGFVGTVIQAYLYRSSDDVRDLNRAGIRVRLVKGAYLEPPSVAFPRKADVDDNYRRLADTLLEHGVYPAFATHDEAIIAFVRERARALGRKADDFEFQMLYGVRRDLQRRLRTEGYGMRVYIPFGTQWYPYLMRRLAERPANLVSILGSVAREATGS